MNTIMARAIEQIKDKIARESLKPGDKLPTLNQLAIEIGVSRTVIREAVISLSSDGLLESRHGVGVFVRDRSASPPLPNFSDAVLEPLSKFKASFMDLLELRLAFEVHAAGLAASRHSWGQESSIWDAANRFEKALDNDEELDEWDVAFHRAIAEATNNSAFIEFFNLMSTHMMPRPAFSRALNPTLITPEYIQQTVHEHRAICEAISAGDASQAQEAMRAHLQRSHQRYRSVQENKNPYNTAPVRD
ncbi:FadR family transcriptional regulator [Falsochrobactrum sp. TDYN1]|uniref:FadR family transcriptional regulator n=1 Tax=Falsochrobactrum tianjinense TaxID=2706015 RepID=A0A949PRW7_9HYPH|nr:FadR/GntR family transcriptional regulator [Falsochrobactrum sp. TDYN1]MBV2144896.1 FadR family transcriptional regulator [Falsochrobactrum sp. TDYN1]